MFCVVGFLHPFWRIPDVSRHTPLMHYFLFSPLVALAFVALGGWLGGQFATGKFTLADQQPVTPQGLGSNMQRKIRSLALTLSAVMQNIPTNEGDGFIGFCHTPANL